MIAALSIFVLVGALIVGAPAFAQQSTDPGRLEYEKGCIGCHGVDAKGGGVHTPRLKNDPPDLTVLARANGGVLPIEKIYAVIDGRAQFQEHGTREMPIWGREYTTREMISLLDYLNRIQQK
jgi:mono/diheme cytochrome c family protein